MTSQSIARRPGIVRRTYRAALWRVRNRLLFTSFLFGVVPLLLMAFLLQQAVAIVLGQYASAVVRQALDDRAATTQTIARLIARTASTLKTDDPGAAADAQLEEIRKQSPFTGLVVQDGGRTITLPETAELRVIPDWMTADFTGLIEASGRFYVAASAVDSSIRVLAHQLLDGEALTRLTRGDVAATIVPVSGLDGTDPDVEVRRQVGGRSYLRRNGVEQTLETSGAIAAPR